MIRALLLFLLLIHLAAPLQAAPPQRPGAQDRCATCGMFVAKYQEWVSIIVFKDGSQLFFDGPKDLFVCLFDLGRYRRGSSLADVATVYVTEYYSAELVDARQVLFVSGSDVLGPMGKELVPVRGHEQAATFRHDHGGQQLLVFDGTDLKPLTAQP